MPLHGSPAAGATCALPRPLRARKFHNTCALIQLLVIKGVCDYTVSYHDRVRNVSDKKNMLCIEKYKTIPTKPFRH